MKKAKKLINEGSSLMGVSLLTRIIDLIRGTIFLKIFSAADFGLIDIINQIINLSKYADIGLLNNVQREYNVLAVNNSQQAEKNKAQSFGMDMIISVSVSILLITYALFSDSSNEIRIGVLFGSLAFLSLKGLKMIQLDIMVKKRFNELGRFKLVNTIILNSLVLSLVYFIGIYAPLIVKPIILISLLIFWWNKSQLNYTFKISIKEFKKQITYGILFSLISVLFGAWVFFERYLITHYFTLTQLGIYAACIFIIKTGKTLVDELFRPASITVKELIFSNNQKIIYNYVLFPSLVFYLILFSSLPVFEYLIGILEINFLSNFQGISEIFKVLSWLIPLYGVSAVSEYILFIKGVDRFKLFYILYFLKFTVMGALCFFYPPLDFKELMIYFLIVETLFFFGKQYTLYTSFFSKRKTFIVAIPIFFIHFFGLYYFQSLDQIIYR